jgi:hypothetical protein
VKKQPDSTRRWFLKNGALLAAPLAAAAAPAAIMADDELRMRLARLEDEAAIRELHQSWLRQFNGGAAEVGAANTEVANATTRLFADSQSIAFGQSVHTIVPDHTAEPDAIKIAADGKTATARFHCAVELETAIAQDSTLAQMARAQGNGFIRSTEPRVLQIAYVRASGQWSIAKAELAPV